MPFQSEVLVFEKSIDTLTPVTQDLTGFSFTPEAYIIYASATDSVTDNIRTSIGFCDSAGGMRCVSFSSTDASGTGGSPVTTQAARLDSDQYILNVMTGSGSTSTQAVHNSYIANGIRIQFLQNNTSAWNFTVIAFGGTDLTNSKAITFSSATATGNQNVNTVGFDPDAVFFLSTNASTTVNTTTQKGKLNFGFACSASRQFATSQVIREAQATSDAYRAQDLGACYISLSGSGGTIIQEAIYTGVIGNGTGFTLNNTVADNVSYPIFALCLKGGSWDCQSVAAPSSAGNQTITTAQGFAPKVAIAQTNSSSDELVNAGVSFAVGAATSVVNPSRATIWNGEADNVAPSQSARASNYLRLLETRITNATGANSTVNRSIDLGSFGATTCVLNHVTAAAGSVYVNVILAGDNITTTTTVEREWSFPMNVRTILEREISFPFQTGGAVDVGPFTQTYDIQGLATREWGFPFNVREYREISVGFPFNVSQAMNLVEREYSFVSNVISLVERDWGFGFSVAEAPGLNLSGYMRPYKVRLFIMNFNGTETLHTFDSFDFEASNIGINKLNFSLHRDSADDFVITVEDSNLMIDTTRVGEGCSVLIQVAKRQTEIGDGNHDVLWGYCKVKKVIRPATNNLVYQFRGYGSSIRTTERIVDFRDEARRLSHSSTEPDLTDVKMQAYKLFARLFTDRSVFPSNRPKELQFDTSQIENQEVKVDAFIPAIDQYMVEMAQAANFIADNSGGVWGINRKKQPYLKYDLTEKPSIILKTKIESSDNRFKTGYVLDSFEFEDSIERGDGYFNCLFGITGTKEATSNVLNLTAIKDKFTPLALDEPPSDAVDPDIISDIGPWIPVYNSEPTAPVFDEVANLAKQWPLNTFRVIIKPTGGTTGFHELTTQQQQAWNTTIDKLQDAVATGIYVYGWIDTQGGSRDIDFIKEDIDSYATLSQVDGIFLDNVSASLSNLSYYKELDDYIGTKFTNMGNSTNHMNTIANAEGPVPIEYYGGTDIERFIVYEDAGLPDVQAEMQSWYNEVTPSRRVVWAHTVPASSVSDNEIKDVVREGSEIENYANGWYITDEDDSPGQYSRISTRITAMMEQLDASAARSLQQSGQAPAGRAIQQDLAMSFIAQSPRTSDLIIILSKVGNPISEADENPNMINGVVTGNRVVEITEEDEFGTTITRQVDMPDYTQAAKIASFNIPFSEVGVDLPTIHFLHKTITKPNVVIGQRYWVLIRGRGQDASNTFRWHHADSVGFDYKSARRVPSSGIFSSARWDVFSNETHPGFALTYMQATTQLSIAYNSTAIKMHGEVDEIVDLSHITDPKLVGKVMNSMLMEGCQIKRVYAFPKVTVPDDPVLPEQVVILVDELSQSGVAAGGTAGGTQSEIVEVNYDFDPESTDQDPEGCMYVSIRSLASYNKTAAYWKARLDRGEWNIDFPPTPTPAERPLPDTAAPVVAAVPKGNFYKTPISVRFVPSEDNVLVYYTTDGSNPVVSETGIAGIESSEMQAASTLNTTELYIPGESSPVLIDKNTDLIFMGVDQRNNRSAVYLEKYTIGEAQGSKAIMAVFFQDTGLTAAQIASSYSGILRGNSDYATLHKRVEEPINSTWENAVLSTPTKYQEVEFQSYDQMAAYVGSAKAKGFDIIGYNIERDDSPDFDTRDVVQSVARFAKTVRKNGLQVRLNPRHDYTKTYGARIAQYADIYNIQAHWYQHDERRFKEFVKDTVQALRANKADIFITITLSAAITEQDSAPGMSRVDTMITRWLWARKNGVDGCRVFFKTDTEFSAIVVPFFQWFNTTGRTVE